MRKVIYLLKSLNLNLFRNEDGVEESDEKDLLRNEDGIEESDEEDLSNEF